MAISKNRLEELIKDGAFIFYIYNEKSIGIIKLDKSYGISVDEYNVINKCKPVFYHVYQDICDADKIFETKEQAEWYIKYHATRTEELNLPTWEEWCENIENYCEIIIFSDMHYNNYEMFVESRNSYDEAIIITKYPSGQYIFFEPNTQESYIKACDLCLKLFKGEE